jgi:hypothetical protein
MVNVLELPSEDVAIALGHTDGGELVRKLYGHRDHERAGPRDSGLREHRQLHADAAGVTPGLAMSEAATIQPERRSWR